MKRLLVLIAIAGTVALLITGVVTAVVLTRTTAAPSSHVGGAGDPNGEGDLNALTGSNRTATATIQMSVANTFVITEQWKSNFCAALTSSNAFLMEPCQVLHVTAAGNGPQSGRRILQSSRLIVVDASSALADTSLLVVQHATDTATITNHQPLLGVENVRQLGMAISAIDVSLDGNCTNPRFLSVAGDTFYSTCDAGTDGLAIVAQNATSSVDVFEAHSLAEERMAGWGAFLVSKSVLYYVRKESGAYQVYAKDIVSNTTTKEGKVFAASENGNAAAVFQNVDETGAVYILVDTTTLATGYSNALIRLSPDNSENFKFDIKSNIIVSSFSDVSVNCKNMMTPKSAAVTLVYSSFSSSLPSSATASRAVRSR